MIHDTVLAPAELFANADERIVPLVSGRDLRLALKRYRVPVSTFALIVDISDAALERALCSRQLSGPALAWYTSMRRYEHLVAKTIESDIEQYSESVLPRFLSDRHMAMYSPECWAVLPSARIACGVSAWVSTHFVSDDGKRVKIYDFNQVRYAQWLDEQALDHDPVALDFWLTKLSNTGN